MKENFCGAVITPHSVEYETARQEFNRSIQKYPSYIAYCTNENEVIEEILNAQIANCKIRVRSGGHNYEGFSVGNCTAVIDVGCIDFIEINEMNGTVTVGSGALNSSIYEAIGAYGYPFPSGTCPTVAAGGITMGGGWGLSSRMFGLTCDNLISMVMINSSGKRIVADDIRNRDLFFALRGGGSGNFGVVTSLTYKLPPKLFNVTYVEMTASGVSMEMASEFIIRFQNWCLAKDMRFTPIARIYRFPDNPRNIVLRGIFYGDKEQAQYSLETFTSLGLYSVFDEMTFLEAIRIVESGYPPYEMFSTGGRFSYKVYDTDEASLIISMIDDLAEGSTEGIITMYALGGKVREESPTNTAFFYRSAINIIALSTNWEEQEAKCDNLKWFAPRFDVLKSLTYGSYVNFPNLENDDYMSEYYGGNANRLRRIKKVMDPNNIFCYPQSIK